MNSSKVSISIIIPIYNVEAYLQQCIDSILAQTYINLEVILINDGSTDKSGSICDEYAKKDDRVVVIHKSNEGIGSARNCGLDCAGGEFLVFVDSDDWLAPDMIEYLQNSLQMHDADISCCGFFSAYVNRNSAARLYNKTEVFYSSKKSLQSFIDRGIPDVAVWGKLYKKSIFKNIRFPISRGYADTCVFADILSAANNIVVEPESKYYYRKRKSSITKEFAMNKELEFMNEHNQFYKSALRHHPDTLIDSNEFFTKARYISLRRMISTCNEYDKIQGFNELYREFSNNFSILIKSRTIKRNDKIKAIAMRISPKLFLLLMAMYNRKNGYDLFD